MLEDEDDGGDDGGDNGVDDDGDGGGVAGLNSNDVKDNGSGDGIVVIVVVVDDDDGDCVVRNDGGGGGGDIGAAVGAAAAVAAAVAVDRRFLLSTNRRSLSANGGMIRLRAIVVAVVVFSLTNRSSSLSLSYASRSCMRPLCIYRQDNKRHTCLITVSNIVLTCISTGYGRSDPIDLIYEPPRYMHNERTLRLPLRRRYFDSSWLPHDSKFCLCSLPSPANHDRSRCYYYYCCCYCL